MKTFFLLCVFAAPAMADKLYFWAADNRYVFARAGFAPAEVAGCRSLEFDPSTNPHLFPSVETERSTYDGTTLRGADGEPITVNPPSATWSAVKALLSYRTRLLQLASGTITPAQMSAADVAMIATALLQVLAEVERR